MSVVPKSNAGTQTMHQDHVLLKLGQGGKQLTERVSRVDDKEKHGETTAAPCSALEARLACGVNGDVVFVREDLLRAERLRRADCRDDLLGERARRRDRLQ